MGVHGISADSAAGPQPLRVLAWPAFKGRGRSYVSLLYSAMVRQGTVVHEFSPARLLRGGYDVLHIHWPERALLHPNPLLGVVGSIGLIPLLHFARARGTRVLWTVHNLEPHEKRRLWLQASFWKLFCDAIDGYIALSPSGAVLAAERYPALADRRGFVVPHGHYRGIYPNSVASREARAELEIAGAETVVAFFGRIRPYKNVPHLIRVFRTSPDTHRILIVAGKITSDQLRSQVIEAVAGDPRVRLFLDFVPNDEVQLFLNAADLVVLPFTEILNSGSALLALSFDRPVLLPDRGAMSELQAEVGKAWVRTFDGELDADVLDRAVHWARNANRTGSAPLDRLSWREVARSTIEAYRTVCLEAPDRLVGAPSRNGSAR